MSNSADAFDELGANIQSDLGHADQHIKELTTWVSTQPTGHEKYAAAYLLQGLYGAIEAILTRSLKLFDEAIPQGQDWRVQLLDLASRKQPGRPSILPQDDTVDELRRFRHRARKRYDVDLDSARLHTVIQAVLASWPEIRAHLEKFAIFVDECAHDE